MKLTITKIYTTNKDKKGNLLKTRDGRDYTRLSIKVAEFADKWLSGFLSSWNTDWREGDVIDVNIEKVQKDGKEYINFSKLDKLDELEARIKELEDAVFEPAKDRDFVEEELTLPEDKPEDDNMPDF